VKDTPRGGSPKLKIRRVFKNGERLPFPVQPFSR
jgi:hypothetical protein